MSANDKEKLTWKSLRWPRPWFTILFGLVVAMGAGVVLDRSLLLNGIPNGAREDFSLMAQAWNLIDTYYVDRVAVRPRSLTYGAINGMINALGDTNHTTFLSREQARRAGSAVEGKLIGIGIEILTSNNQAVVVTPLDGSPAKEAGVRSGDIIMEVNGRPVTGLSMGQLSARIAGEPGQPVLLTLKNPRDKQTRQLNVARASIRLNNISWQRLPGTDIAHVRIAMFSEGVTSDLKKALGAMQTNGIKKIILDLRGNPGGALDEAIGVASQFLANGNVLWERDATSNLLPMPVKPGGLAINLPMAVLINGSSASDSEIVAGALHDNKRATLVGTRTFGTGTVLSEFTLSDGSVLLLAVEEWLTPNKNSFWHRGIEPDLQVKLPPDGVVLRPSTEKEMTVEEWANSQDTQLHAAVEALKKL